MYTICSRFAICSFRALGTGPFPKPLVPFDSLGWPLLENTPNNNRRLLNVISMTATNLSTRLGGRGNRVSNLTLSKLSEGSRSLPRLGRLSWRPRLVQAKASVLANLVVAPYQSAR